MQVVVGGGSGFLGCRLLRVLLEDEEVQKIAILSRSKSLEGNTKFNAVLEKYGRNSCIVEVVQWNPKEVTEELVRCLDGSDVIIHLAGTSIFQKRWTESFKQDLIDSRIISSKVLVEGIGQCKQKPKVLVSASGVSYYGDSGDEILSEKEPAGEDFLAKLSVDWEAAVKNAEDYGVRTCSARIGIVLGTEGGALLNMMPLFAWHVGGHVGNGENWFPWIHADDCARAIFFAAKNDTITGSFNATSPSPVKMKEFCQELGKAMNRWSWAHAPYLAVRIMLGEVATVICSSLRVVPSLLLEHGFEFHHASLPDALEDIINKN